MPLNFTITSAPLRPFRHNQSPEPQSRALGESPSTFGKPQTRGSRGDTERPWAPEHEPEPEHEPRGGSVLSNAHNTVISDGNFVACDSAEVTIHTTSIVHHNSRCSQPPTSVLFLVPATLWTPQPPAVPSIQDVAELKPPPFELALRYRAPLPVYYEDLPILFAPLFFVYLWRFVFGYHSLTSNV